MLDTRYRFLFALLAAATLTSQAVHAKSWCALPLFVHEWGVQVFDGTGIGVPSVALPAYFHRPGNTTALPAQVPVRQLPADGGERDLPVMHFYSPRGDSAQIPIGIEVGFAAGRASAWFPDVDELGPNPERQLVWNRLDLGPRATFPVAAPDSEWVKAARALGGLWVNSARESERFVFYEGRTSEQVPLILRRAAGWKPERRAYELVNRGTFELADVLFVHRDGKTTYVFSVPKLLAGATATFTLEDQRVSDVRAATWDALRASLLDATTPEPLGADGDRSRCVMQRNPADAFRQSSGHRLYRGEVDLILSVWGERFFGADPAASSTRVVYRESSQYLDQMMPLALYTDMYNFVELRRASLGLWSGVVLP